LGKLATVVKLVSADTTSTINSDTISPCKCNIYVFDNLPWDVY